MSDTSVPFNIEAEKAIIGSFLNNNANLDKVSDFLKPAHLYVPLHTEIYEKILKLTERSLIATPITLKSYFEDHEAMKELQVSSLEYLLKLATNSASIINLVPYAKDVYECYVRRELIKIAEEMTVEAHKPKPELSALRLIEKSEQKLFQLVAEGRADRGFITIKEGIDKSIEKLDVARKKPNYLSGITTGFKDMDKLLSGLQPSDLIILAARPSMGKTSLAISIALNAAVDSVKGGSVGIFSLEMSSEQITNKLISMKTGINGGAIRTGMLSNSEFEKLIKQTDQLSQLPIFIDDTPALEISSLCSRARQLKAQHNIGLLVVDYLQLVRGTRLSNDRGRVNEIGEISQGLKAIAKELNVPVLALSQLSRAVETREDKRPQLSDLRESGNIEQDADVVAFIYREEYYMSRAKPKEDETEKFKEWQNKMEACIEKVEVIIAKQRNGPVGVARLKFEASTTCFKNAD